MHKAERMRRETGDSRWHSPLDTMQNKPFRKRIEDTLARPFKILFQEPMLIATTLYMSVSLSNVVVAYICFIL